MRKKYLLILLIFIHVYTGFAVAETAHDVVRSLQHEGIYDPYFDTYTNMARLKKIPDEQLLVVLKQKKEYLVYVKNNYAQFSQQMVPYVLYFSDIGILKENIPLLQSQESALKSLPVLKDFLTMLSVTFAATHDELNEVFVAVCKYYSAEDIKTVATHIRQQNLKSAGTHARRIYAVLLQHIRTGSSIKLIIRNLREVTQ